MTGTTVSRTTRSCNLLRMSRVLALIGCLASTPVAVAQGEATLGAIQAQFVNRAAAGDVNAVRALSKGREAALAVVLADTLAQARHAGDDLALVRRLRKSLAVLGDRSARRAIANELDNTNRYIQQYAFRDACEIGGNDLIAAVAIKLTDPSPGGRPVGPTGNVESDVGIAAPRHQAVIALSILITDPSAPRIDLDRIQYRDEDVERWQIWWNSNKAKYEYTGFPLKE